MNAETIINQASEALKKFGTYAFDDKGPTEVMGIDGIVEALNKQDVPTVIATLEEVFSASVGKGKERAQRVVSSIVLNMQNVPSERWNELMKSKILDEAYNL